MADCLQPADEGIQIPRAPRQSHFASGSVTMLGQVAKIILQFSSILILSRLLDPEAFGIFAIAAAVIAFGELIRDFGISTAAIQVESLSQRQKTNLFWIGLLIGGVLAACTAALARPVGNWLDEPRLEPLLCVAASTFLINSLQVQFQVNLVRDRRYLALASSDVIATAIGLLLGCVAALNNWGYWSLAVQQLTCYTVLLILRFTLSPWRPGLPRRNSDTRGMLQFGRNLGAAQVLGYFAGNTDSWVISARFGAGPLGFYNRAFQLLTVPVNQILTPLTNVILPELAASTSDKRKFSNLTKSTQFALGWVCIPLFGYASAISRPAIETILGARWAPSADIFSILCVGGAFQVLTFVGYWVFLAHGATDQLLRYNLLTKSGVVALVIVGSQFSIEWVATGYAAGLVVSWPICMMWIQSSGLMHSVDLVKDAILTLITGGSIFVCCSLLRDSLEAWGTSNVLQIILCLVLAVAHLPLVWTASRRTRSQYRTAVETLTNRVDVGMAQA